MEEIRLSKKEQCPKCGVWYRIIGRYFSYKRSAMYVEDYCENGCMLKRERVKYT